MKKEEKDEEKQPPPQSHWEIDTRHVIEYNQVLYPGNIQVAA